MNKTNERCKRIALITLIVIVLCAFFAQLIITDGYKISVSHVTLDVRGADLTMDVYHPYKVTADTKLPCMIISHGGSECLSADSIHAWEYARRGIVVINVNMYGAGTADMPDYFEDGKPYNRNQGTSGLYDALEYARSISYVDTARIGMWGHSQSYSIIGSVCVLDGELLSLNDRLFNALYEEFKVPVTAEMLSQDANEIAKQYLNQDQLGQYEYIKAECEKTVDSYVRAARVMDNNCCLIKTKVAGIDVVRSIHTNLQIGGERNGTSTTSATRFTQPNDRYKTLYCTDSGMERNHYFLIPDTVANPGAKSTDLGGIGAISAQSNSMLRDGFENRSIYISYNPSTMHNGNLWSPKAITPTMEFFLQALSYNNGELADAATQPIPTSKLAPAYFAIALTTIATFAMLVFICAVAGILLQMVSFKGIEVPTYEPRLKIKSLDFLLATAIALVVGFVGAYFGSRETLGLNGSNSFMSKWLPTEPGHFRLIFQMMATALCAVVLWLVFFLVYKYIIKKESTVAPLSAIKLNIGVKNIFKTLFITVVLFVIAYILEAFMEGAFDVRFQFIDGSFELMKGYSFVRMFKYFLILLPWTFILSYANNLVSIKGISDKADTAILVAMQSLGCWIFMLIANAITFSTPDHMTALGLHTMLPAIFLVPMTNYLFRKLYKATGSIWAGAFMVDILLAWRLASYVSHRFMFWGYDSMITRFLGI
jgi:hypothetical protein